MTEPAPVGATVQKRCTCGGLAQHRDAAKHPRYIVVDHVPNRWAPPHIAENCGWAHLRRIDTGRVHRTSLIVLRDAYTIVDLPTDAVLISPGGAA